MEIPIEVIAFVGIILGVIGRTYFPYLKKTKQAEQKSLQIGFDARYLITAIFSGIVTAIFVFPLFVIPNETPFKVVLAAFVFAWMSDDALNRVITA